MGVIIIYFLSNETNNYFKVLQDIKKYIYCFHRNKPKDRYNH